MNLIANTLVEEEVCPYGDNAADECKASVTSLKIGELLRLHRCNSEIHENYSFLPCPVLPFYHDSYFAYNIPDEQDELQLS